MKRCLIMLIAGILIFASQARAQENEEILAGYGWVDREKGIVRIPIERAMELTVERYAVMRKAPPVVEPILEAAEPEERAEPPAPVVIDPETAARGKELFEKFKCHTCHGAGAIFPGSDHAGLYYRKVKLTDGSTVVADEAYIRESILNPAEKLVEGYDPTTMLSYEGLLTEDELLAVIEYIRSL